MDLLVLWLCNLACCLWDVSILDVIGWIWNLVMFVTLGLVDGVIIACDSAAVGINGIRLGGRTEA